MYRSWSLAGIVLAIAAVLIIGFVILRPGAPVPIGYYRLVDGDTIIVGVDSSEDGETRVTSVEETQASVTITVQWFSSSILSRAGVGIPMEFTVDLQEPLGDREVRDLTHVVREKD